MSAFVIFFVVLRKPLCVQKISLGFLTMLALKRALSMQKRATIYLAILMEIIVIEAMQSIELSRMSDVTSLRVYAFIEAQPYLQKQSFLLVVFCACYFHLFVKCKCV